MSARLQEAIARAQLLADFEQERIAALLAAEVDQAVRDEAFDALLSSRPDLLQRMADEAGAEHQAGRTVPLAPDAF